MVRKLRRIHPRWAQFRENVLGGSSVTTTNSDEILDERLKLAYEASSARLTQQDGTLQSLRNRATGLLTFGALITSFAAGVGLINTGGGIAHSLPHWDAYALLGVIALIGLCSFYVLWPVDGFGFGPDAQRMLDRRCDGADVNVIALEMARRMVRGVTDNDHLIEPRMSAFRAGSVLLVVEVVLVVIGFVVK